MESEEQDAAVCLLEGFSSLNEQAKSFSASNKQSATQEAATKLLRSGGPPGGLTVYLHLWGGQQTVLERFRMPRAMERRLRQWFHGPLSATSATRHENPGTSSSDLAPPGAPHLSEQHRQPASHAWNTPEHLHSLTPSSP